MTNSEAGRHNRDTQGIALAVCQGLGSSLTHAQHPQNNHTKLNQTSRQCVGGCAARNTITLHTPQIHHAQQAAQRHPTQPHRASTFPPFCSWSAHPGTPPASPCPADLTCHALCSALSMIVKIPHGSCAKHTLPRRATVFQCCWLSWCP
jgi:hypothetical protein